MSVQSPPTPAPLSVGRYELIGRAGVGISEVYRARSAEGALVAVYLYPEGTDPLRLRARLDAAVEAAAELDHPNVLRVIDGGREAGYGYLVTEWVDGTTLARMIEIHGRLPEANVIRFVAQIGQAVDHVRRGDRAVCRVDPSNVLVRPDGVAKLIPFELPGERLTAPIIGAAVLKPEFATPDADRPRSKSVPFAELIFSLGTTLHEALTGAAWTPPEPAPSSRRRPPRSVGLTERTERAIRRATNPDPTKRPASCAELMMLLHGRPITAGTLKPDARATAADDRRGYVRYALGVGTNCTINRSVFDAPTPPAGPDSQEIWPLVVQDVSAGGIGILLARRCEPGTELVIEVPAGADRTVRSLPARVVRVRKDNFGHWMHGCAFLAPLEEPELTALRDHLGRSDPA